jgi:hypothetical protein
MKRSRDNAMMEIAIGLSLAKQVKILMCYLSSSRTISREQFDAIYEIMKKIQRGLQGMQADNEIFRKHLNNRAYAAKIMKPYAQLARETAAEIQSVLWGNAKNEQKY